MLAKDVNIWTQSNPMFTFINHLYLLAFKRGRYIIVTEKCDACLRLLSKYRDEQVPDKYEMVANLHSYVGNAAMQTGKLDMSIRHHEVDLMLGNTL